MNLGSGLPYGVGGNIAVSIGRDGVLIVDDQLPLIFPKIKEAIKRLSLRVFLKDQKGSMSSLTKLLSDSNISLDKIIQKDENNDNENNDNVDEVEEDNVEEGNVEENNVEENEHTKSIQDCPTCGSENPIGSSQCILCGYSFS